jgi:hypothetical protein
MKKLISILLFIPVILLFWASIGLLVYEDNRDVFPGLLFLGASIIGTGLLYRFGKF